MNIKFRKSLGVLSATLILSSPLTAFAASLTQNIALAGAVAPQPATCAFNGSASMSFNREQPMFFASSDSPTAINITCTNNVAYSFSVASNWSPVMIGTEAAGLSLANTADNWELSSKPITGTGSGSQQTFNLKGLVGGAGAYRTKLDFEKHVGAVTGTVKLTLTY